MSADNGTYVLQTSDGKDSLECRVAQAHAIENIFDERKGQKILVDIFKESPPVSDLMSAMDIAHMIENQNETEHGVLVITHFREMTFDDIERASNEAIEEDQNS
jgi:divalent metal cation (Fe/Co/Zn/Cd) transporter